MAAAAWMLHDGRFIRAEQQLFINSGTKSSSKGFGNSLVEHRGVAHHSNMCSYKNNQLAVKESD